MAREVSEQGQEEGTFPMTPWNECFVGCDLGGSCTPTEPHSVRAAGVWFVFLASELKWLSAPPTAKQGHYVHLTPGPQRPGPGRILLEGKEQLAPSWATP